MFEKMLFGQQNNPTYGNNRAGVTNIKRCRRSIDDLFAEYGPIYSKRAYRMDKVAFDKLNKILETFTGPKKRTSCDLSNDGIPAATKLSVALRFFAGGDPLDIMITHGISHPSVYKCVWSVVDAVNSSKCLDIKFPSTHEEQLAIADGFRKKSAANLDSCVGAIDGMLLWTTKIRLDECDAMHVGQGKFHCGRKGKYGLCFQGTCDHNRRFIDVYIGHPGSTADLLAYSVSPLKTLLEKEDFLAPGLALFGDNAYMNSSNMVTPFKNCAVGSDEDNFNFYQSQLRINIECAFGMFTQRWGILRKPLNASMGIPKIIALVS